MWHPTFDDVGFALQTGGRNPSRHLFAFPAGTAERRPPRCAAEEHPRPPWNRSVLDEPHPIVTIAGEGCMQKINAAQIEWQSQRSPSGKFARSGKKLSEALGREPRSMDLAKRHPFDVELQKVPPRAASCPFHSHSAQWEFYVVVSGRGKVRHADGTMSIEPGDAYLFKPGEPHQLINDSGEDLLVYVIADNPIGETCYYHDSQKWAVRSPEYRLMRGQPLDYYDGEE
jgi:uncharacterized cupin superfamily protein